MISKRMRVVKTGLASMVTCSALFLRIASYASALRDGAIKLGECGALGLRCGGIAGGDSFVTIAERILGLVNAFLFLTAAIALGFIIYGAALYVMSRGDEDRARSAKNAIVWAVLGLIITSFAGLLVNAVIRLNFF